MVGSEPEIRSLRSSVFASRFAESRGIAALHYSDDASDLEGANPLAPPTFLGETTVRQVPYLKRSG